jgi:hypothetical protein
MQRSEEGMDGTEYRAGQSQTDKHGIGKRDDGNGAHSKREGIANCDAIVVVGTAK